ncbi:hypothetical protein CN878_02545 [Ochrobactrum sp. 695/2009]|nr:hypothetical protein [Brucella intermedia]PJR90002.1 hypothetical protein CN881_12470 [Ochrobactrum sp. 721/2009]PJT14219.1 hypothetical protein CN880_21500 [Ochrobactrum sp. 720/2009]PJT24388.1 hypothetical protein CN879_08530 [Ochrobactrum sp. 715/2009]PJT30287.1 hypothetical protein CN878_02545 [Ochrobactrum sp. 695/2009]PJT33814.1 hypothetical protein CN877_09440 [Ochrobactrum sp. 689/2009]
MAIKSTTVSEEAVKAAMIAQENSFIDGYDPDIQMKAALTAALPHLPGVCVKKLDLTILERLADYAEQYDHPDENGPFPDIQDVMVTVGDLRQARKLLSILSEFEPSAARELALEEAARLCDTLEEKTNRPSVCAAAIRALSSPDHNADAGKLDAVTICKKLAPYLGATEANDWRGLKDDDAISLTVKLRVGDLRTLKAVATDEAEAGKVEGDEWLPMTHPDLPLNGASVVMFDSFIPGKDGFGQVIARFDKTHGWHVAASVVGGIYIQLTNPIKWRPLFSAPSQEVAGS